MAGSVPPRDLRRVGERKITARRGHPLPVQDESSVVQRVVLPEYRDDELLRYLGAQVDGRSPVVPQPGLLLQHHKRPDPVRLHVVERARNLPAEVLRLVQGDPVAPQVPAPHLLQHLPQLRLKHDGDGKTQSPEAPSQQPGEKPELEDRGQQREEEEYQHSLQQLDRPRSNHQDEDAIKDQGNDEDIEKGPYVIPHRTRSFRPRYRARSTRSSHDPQFMILNDVLHLYPPGGDAFLSRSAFP